MTPAIISKVKKLNGQPNAPIGDESVIVPQFDAFPPDEKWLSPLVAQVPDHIELGALRDGRLRVISPISVNLSTEENNVIAEAVEFNEFGFGKNSSEAIVDLQRAIAELYFTLEDEQDRLGLDLQRVWDRLQEKIYKR